MKEWNYEDEWYEEDNIALKIKDYFEGENFKILKFNKSKRTKGHDLKAIKNSVEYVIEVKGYPSDKYTLGIRKGQIKANTTPKKQAKIWFGRGIYQLIRAKCKDPKIKIVLGLPLNELYKELLNEIKYFREKMELICVFVDENGFIQLIESNIDLS